jgi:hypothetical protein
MDSITVTEIPRLVTRNFLIRDTLSAPPYYPDTLSTPHNRPIFRSFGFKPHAPSGLPPAPVQTLYRQFLYDIPESTATAVVAARYPAAPAEAQVIYFSMHLYDCTDQFIDLMRNILTREFENAGN